MAIEGDGREMKNNLISRGGRNTGIYEVEERLQSKGVSQGKRTSRVFRRHGGTTRKKYTKWEEKRQLLKSQTRS